ncbi:hypothetical protein OG258_49405 [Streptomyces mirabilis]|uniref:RIO1 family regulatory kinase/ATPase domain-containing protein n=1 Tax=Streptomyces mirabilis TaxID=68239 RepID=UPI002E27C559|nr:RIO1 family regulatory kinase/ATPase [Streptomyces mirabilis]
MKEVADPSSAGTTRDRKPGPRQAGTQTPSTTTWGHLEPEKRGQFRLLTPITVVDEDGAVQTAPRLAQTRPSPELLAAYFEQLTDALATMVQNGIVHGDLSAYNILAAGERLVIIDLPQIVDLVGNLNGMNFLQRDCANICGWFRSRGLEVDEHALFAELMAHAF